MRFEQLKHDPNSVMRKKLVKSKKNWIVVATLSLAGGIFLMGTPSLNVKADTIPTQINAAKSSTTTQSPTDSSTTAQTNTAVQSTIVDNNQASTDATNESKSTANVAESPTTSASTSTNNDNKTDSTNTVETNLAKSKIQLESLGVTPTELSADTNTATTANTNIAQGIQGTTPWFISADGSLHLGDSTQTTALADNTTTTTDKVSGSSSTETATTPTTTTTTPTATPSDTSSTDTNSDTSAASTTTNTASDTDTSNTSQKQSSTNSDTAQNSSLDNSNSTTSTTNTAPTTPVATSPWQKYANNINNITFDGKVTGADDMNHMFSDLSNLTTINNINQLDTSSTENVSGLFANDTKLTTVTGSKTTDEVVDLSDLNLTSLNDTSDMFLDDSSIQDITFPERASTIKKGVNFNYMFKNDISLNALDVSNWQFSYAKTMLGMFQNDKKLKNLSISSWNMDTNPDTGDSSKNEGMFDGTDLQSITLSSADTFKNYTALPSSKSNGWTDGNVAFSAEPNNSDNYNYNLNSVKGSLNLYPATFTPNSESDPTVPKYTVTLTVPTSLGNQTFTHTGTLNSSFSVTPNTFPGYTPDISTVVATITSTTQATTNYYINYVGNLVSQWTVNGVNSPTGQTMTVTGTTSSTGDPARIGDTFYINPDTTNTGYTVSKVGSGLISADENGNPTYTVLTQPEYVGIDVPESSAQFTTTTGVTKNVTIPEGQYGNTSATIEVPDIPGYTLSADSPKTLQVTYNKDGTSSVDTSKVTYIPNTVPSWTVDNLIGPDNTKVSASGTTNIDNTTAKIGDTVSISPDVSGTGYQVEKPGTGVITANTTTGAPEVDIKTEPTYKPITINASSVTFKTKTGSETVEIPEGQYGDTTTTIDVPDIPGYTLSTDSPKTLQVTYNKDGTSSVDTSKVTYVPNTVTSWTASDVKGPDDTTISVSGTTNSDNTTAKVGDTVSIDPDVSGTGYQVLTPGTGTIIIDPKTGEPTIRIDKQPTYEPITIPKSSVTFTTTTGVTKDVEIPEGKYGNTATTITVPDIPGYTLSADSPKTLQVTYNKDGSSSVDTSKVTYVPNKVTAWTTNNVKGPENTTISASGSTNSDNATAKIGDTVSINPDVSGTGYQVATPGIGTIKANTTTGAPEIDITTQPTYEPIMIPKSSVTFTAASGSTSTVSIPEGNYGNTTTTIEVPDIPGYTLSSDSPKNLNVIYNKDGTSSVDISSVKYIPNTVPSWTVSGVVGPDNTTVSASGSTNSNNVTAKIGDTISIDPDVTGTGYRVQTPGIGKIYADPKTGQPEIKITNNPIYIPIPIPSSTQTITTKDGTTIQITTPTGDVTIKNQTVNVPKIPGYTASESTLPISYNKDGSVTVDSSNLTYTPNNVPNWSTTVTDPTGKTIQVSGTNAKVGQTVTLSPNIPGYDTIPGIAVIKANSDGSTFLDIAKAPTYSPTKVPTWSTSVNGPTADSQIKINGTDVHYGQTIILNPNTDNSGYTVNKPGKGVIAIGKDGHFYVSVTQQPSYTANPVKNWQTTISLPNHQTMQVSGNTNSDNQSAKFGDTVTIKPEVPGYQVTPGTGIIVADKNGQPTIQIITEPKFTKIPSTTTQPTVQKADLDISTYPDSSNIPIYQWNYDNMTVLKSQQLAPQTDWFTDQTIVVSGIKYYRIATNEWVKASQVYPYRDLDTQIRTYDKTTKVLYESADQIVGNREIQPNSSWYSDQIAYFIDGEKYYRIADDEFVKDSDAYVYQPTKMTVRVKNDTPIQNLYTAKGELITNRSLVADSDWFVDSIVYINGIKYYRVATDEFVKASDVDTDH
ncbi:hypothetical protein NBRC111452_1372 [Companilactobacillus farciminis]|nr:hypothetical protein NBRC111452_1372 [Companilactobacillus farciminis]